MWIFEWPLGWFKRAGGLTIFDKPGIKAGTQFGASRVQTRYVTSRTQTRQ